MVARDKIESPILAFARVGLGFIFFAPGLKKVQTPQDTLDWFEQMRIPVAHFTAPLMSWLELVCGLLLIGGLLTQIAAGIMAADSAGILIFYNFNNLPHFNANNVNDILSFIAHIFGATGWLLLALSLLLTVCGGGNFALDRFFSTENLTFGRKGSPKRATATNRKTAL